MSILSYCPPIPDQGDVTIFGRDCNLHSVTLPSLLACDEMTDYIAFINTHKESAPLSSYFLDFHLEHLSALCHQTSGTETQTGPNTSGHGSNICQDAATNTSISISGPAEASPFLEIEENPWKRAWIAWRAGMANCNQIYNYSHLSYTRDISIQHIIWNIKCNFNFQRFLKVYLYSHT